jgi:hypothetical protein
VYYGFQVLLTINTFYFPLMELTHWSYNVHAMRLLWGGIWIFTELYTGVTCMKVWHCICEFGLKKGPLSRAMLVFQYVLATRNFNINEPFVYARWCYALKLKLHLFVNSWSFFLWQNALICCTSNVDIWRESKAHVFKISNVNFSKSCVPSIPSCVLLPLYKKE